MLGNNGGLAGFLSWLLAAIFLRTDLEILQFQVSLFQASESYDNQAQSWMLEDLFYDCETGEEAEFSVLSWNNVGYTLGCSDEDTPVPLLEALSHYSWHKSQGRMLVLFTKVSSFPYNNPLKNSA